MLRRMLELGKGDRFDPTDAVFPNINVDKIANDLRLKQIGLERGRKNLPGPKDQVLDSVEHQIVGAIEELRNKGLSHFEQHQQVYGERLTRASESRVQIETIAVSAETDFQGEIKTCNAEMANQRKMVSVAGDALQRFYDKHPVEGAARERSSNFKLFGLVSFMIVIESMGNGILLREASTQGWLGGFFIAVSISILNVGFSALTGLSARYFNHVSWFRKLLALFGAATFALLVCAVNIAAGHYRDSATKLGIMEEAASEALDTLIATPYMLDSLQSWMLVGLGVLIAIVAGWKGYSFDEPYPGFGHIWRQMSNARVAYAIQLRDAIDEIFHARDDAIENLRNESDAARDRIDEAIDALAGSSSLYGRLGLFIEQCDQKVNHLLAIYRDANREVREAEAPAHFLDEYSFKPYELGKHDNGVTNNARKEQDEIRNIVSCTIERIKNGAETAIATYPETHELENQTLTGKALAAARANPVVIDQHTSSKLNKHRKIVS